MRHRSLKSSYGAVAGMLVPPSLALLAFASFATPARSQAFNCQDTYGSISGFTGPNALACGSGANAFGVNSSAIGNGATVDFTGTNAVAIGYNSVADEADTVSVGNTTNRRRVVNVAAGVDGTDAVNMNQLETLSLFVGFNAGATIVLYDQVVGLSNGTIGIVQQNGVAAPITVGNATDGTVVDFTGTDGTRTLTGVRDGAIALGSQEAVTGNQLFATNNRVTATETSITNLTTNVNNGTVGLVQRDTLTNAITVASTFGGTSVDFTGTDGARVLSGVANGIAATDAVNLSQLNAALSGLTVNMPIVGNNTSGFAAPAATGADALAAGYGSRASGANSLAVGTNAQATFEGATAIGAGARATADPTTAVGFQAAATGNNASAFGGNSVASAVNSTAIGQDAQATATAATALGQGSRAAFAGSTAVGAGAATTRTNQVAVGTAASTYTLAGINSAASRSAQTGTTRLVTADQAGNLGVSDFDFTSIAALDGRVGNLETGLANLTRFSYESRREARQGVAAAMAMTTASMPSAPGRTSWSMNGASFKGEYAFGGSLAHRFDTQMPLAITAGYAYAGDNSHGVRVGLAGEF
ncbi:hypothetical protein [Microvirga antarctica]|uniref:hypothetical protein n=1 Tax=Microvirga antarctica TaxID=2819233 RepID=UPI001B30E4D6|nr:hypothetical protein [Microvirga antarctica]